VSETAIKRLILASSSPRRRDLMHATGLSFTIARPDIDETPLPDEAPDRYVARLSREKALAIPAKAGDVVLSADTTVVKDGAIIGKPADAAEATTMLQGLRARPHLVHTAISVRDVDSGQIRTQVTTTRVIMRAYSDAEIATYVQSGEPYDKAGGYAVQDEQFRPVELLDGCHTNVVGLPMCAACALLAEVGIHLTAPTCSPSNLPCVVSLPK